LDAIAGAAKMNDEKKKSNGASMTIYAQAIIHYWFDEEGNSHVEPVVCWIGQWAWLSGMWLG